MKKSIEELRQSPYHQELARKMCAAYIAQQQGVTLDTAIKKVSDPIGDLWFWSQNSRERVVPPVLRWMFPRTWSEGTRDS